MFTPEQACAVVDGYRAHLAALARQTPDWAMPVDQAQEHWDHVAGSASDHQNAYSLSRMSHRSGLQGVQDLVRAGLHVVVVTGPAYCRSTDALIGTHYSPVACFRDRAAAQAEAAAIFESWGDDPGDCSIAIYPLPAQEPAAARAGRFAALDDDLPF